MRTYSIPPFALRRQSSVKRRAHQIQEFRTRTGGFAQQLCLPALLNLSGATGRPKIKNALSFSLTYGVELTCRKFVWKGTSRRNLHSRFTCEVAYIRTFADVNSRSPPLLVNCKPALSAVSLSLFQNKSRGIFTPNLLGDVACDAFNAERAIEEAPERNLKDRSAPC